MLVLHKTLKSFGGTVQIQPSMKKEAGLLCSCIIVLSAPPAAVRQEKQNKTYDFRVSAQTYR